ncbi:MAG: nitroreductase family deazaflavin-dependent oxidoreductase [Actinomycetota bacterium]|nr:nitroreductase family deazaflavin-dependent oxidoreductase [Actinomycetota bacterium]
MIQEKVTSYKDANAFYRFMRSLGAIAPVSWFFARTLHHLDTPVYRLTKGRHTFANLVSGLPVVMLTTVGRRSGRPRTVPVLGIPDGETTAVIASNYGQRHHPAWCHNLRANPEASISIDGVSRRVTVHEAEGAKRERIMRRAVEIYPGWRAYERRASNRRIAVFVLTPAVAR